MARTHFTAHIKQRVAIQTAEETEDEARARTEARTRSELATVVAAARAARAAPIADVGSVDESNAEDVDSDADASVHEDDADEDECGDEDFKDTEYTEDAEVSGSDNDSDSSIVSRRRGGASRKQRRQRSITRKGSGERTNSSSFPVKFGRGKKRSSSDIHDDELVRVPELEVTEHESWAMLAKYLREYMSATRQVIVIQETYNVKRRNKALRAQSQYAGVDDKNMPWVPEAMDPYQRKYICTHGWPERDRGTGKKPRQNIMQTGCPFQLLAQVVQRPDDGVWVVAIKREVYYHNHPISDEVYRNYPGVRQVPIQSPLMPNIEMLAEAQAAPSAVYDYIRSNSDHQVTMIDVRNLLARIRRSGSNLSDDDAVAEIVTNFNLESKYNVGTVHQSARGYTGVVSLTSGHMRAMLDKFPEVLQMDTTHKTNKYNYQLLSIVAMDQFGNGQPVQYSFLETTSDWHMGKCLDHFKRTNDHWRVVRIVIVDKDIREIEVIKKKLPEARVLLCHFHVIKRLHDVVRKRKYGPYSCDVLAQMKYTISNMTYSRTLDEYSAHYDEFKSLTCRHGKTELWDYFVKNWHGCKEMWVMAYRTQLPHFQNHTNNRVESFFGKVKQHVDSYSTMNQCISALLSWQQRKEEDYRAKVEMPGTLRDSSYPEEMNIVLQMTTPWVAEAIHTQYKIATGDTSLGDYTIVDNGNTVGVHKGDHVYQLNKDDLTCDCEFAMTMKLPCRHAMIYRRSLGSPFVIPYNAIEPRWSGQARISLVSMTEHARPFVAKVYKEKGPVVEGILTEREKYCQAQKAFARIGSELARLPDTEFRIAMTTFDNWWHNLRQGAAAIGGIETVKNTAESGHGSSGSTEADIEHNTVSDPRSTSSVDCESEGADTSSSACRPDADHDQVGIADGFDACTGGHGDDELLTIRFNGAAPTPGRPRLDRNEQRLQSREARRAYNRGTRLRALLQNADACEVVAILNEICPPLCETSSFLTTFPVKFEEHKNTKSMTWHVPSSIVRVGVCYRLPLAMVNYALEVYDALKLKLHGGKIPVTCIGGTQDDENESPIPVVVIEKVGEYTLSQLVSMKWLWNLENTCRAGIKCTDWLSKSRVVENTIAPRLREYLSGQWPYASVLGASEDVAYSSLYCLRPGVWLNDDVILAFTSAISLKYTSESKKTAMVMLPQVSRAATIKTVAIGSVTMEKIRVVIGQSTTVLMPVNFGGVHWTCLAFDPVGMRVNMYDSTDKVTYVRLLEVLAAEVNNNVLGGKYEIFHTRTPVQRDQDSCGVYVCLHFWRYVDSNIARRLMMRGSETIRWNILKLVLETAKDHTMELKIDPNTRSD